MRYGYARSSCGHVLSYADVDSVDASKPCAYCKFDNLGNVLPSFSRTDEQIKEIRERMNIFCIPLTTQEEWEKSRLNPNRRKQPCTS